MSIFDMMSTILRAAKKHEGDGLAQKILYAQIALIMVQLIQQTASKNSHCGRFWTTLKMLTSVILRTTLRTTRCCVPVADRPERRAIGPCLDIQHHCQEIPRAGAPRERIAVRCATAAARGALSSGLRSVRPRNRRA